MQSQSLVTRKTTCPLDCPDLCSLEVNVSAGRVVEISGDADHPITQGYICRKVRHFADHVYGDHRLRTPARRSGAKGEGQFEPISWDDALSVIAERMTTVILRHGAEAILPFCYGGSNGKLTQDTTDARLFRRLKTSRLARTVCAAPSGRAFGGLYGKMEGVAFPDYVQARLIVVWGANPNASGIHLVPFIRTAQKQGAKLIVVDPRKTPLAKQADLHLQIRPGTDLVVALAIINWLFESNSADEAFLAEHATGVHELKQRAANWSLEQAAEVARVPVGSLEQFGRMYAETNPAVIRCGWGLERNRNGGSAIAAVLALPAVAGKFGVRGGGFTSSNSAAWHVATDAAVGEPEPDTRIINMNHMGKVLVEEQNPPIDFLFVYNANPLATLPNQQRVREGLLREDLFTVVFDQVMTDTAQYADIVLPATTFLEHTDYRVSYGTGSLAKTTPVIDAIGESRPNYEVFAQLCDRLGLTRPNDSVDPDSLFEKLFESNGATKSLRAEVEQHGWLPSPSGSNPVQFVDVLPKTPDGKVHLVPESLDQEAPHGLYHYQEESLESPSDTLALLSPSTAHTISSTLGQLEKRQIPVELHPDDALTRGISDGDQVRVFNRYGEVHCEAIRNRDLQPGVAVLPKGLWSHNTLNGNTANALAPDTLADLGGGACFNDCRVQIELRGGG